MGVKIAGCKFYVPEKKLTNFELEKMVDTSDEWILQRTGIKERHITEENISSSDLAIKSSLEVIKEAKIKKEDINLIIVATVTSDYSVPSCANILQDKIGAKRAGAFDINSGCAGFIYGLIIGSQFIINNKCKNVLVVGVETLSKITDFTDRNTCVLFGDGAGSVILQKDGKDCGLLSFILGSDGEKYSAIIVPAGGSKIPASFETIEKKLHFIKMDGRAVFEFAVNKTADIIRDVVKKAKLNLPDIKYFLLHQANIRILESIRKKLDIPEDKILINIEKYGNTSSASIPILLSEAVSEGKIKKNDILLFAGFGAGLSWGACVWKW